MLVSFHLICPISEHMDLRSVKTQLNFRQTLSSNGCKELPFPVKSNFSLFQLENEIVVRTIFLFIFILSVAGLVAVARESKLQYCLIKWEGNESTPAFVVFFSKSEKQHTITHPTSN